MVDICIELNKITGLGVHKNLRNDGQCTEIINDLKCASDIKFGGSSVVLIYPNFIVRLIEKTRDKQLPINIDNLVSIPNKELVCSSIFYNIYIEEFVENFHKLNTEDFTVIKQFVVNMVYKGYLVIDICIHNFLKDKNSKIYFVDYEGIYNLTDQCELALIILFVYNLYNLKQFCYNGDYKKFIPYQFTPKSIHYIIKFVNHNCNNLMQNFFDVMVKFNVDKFIELVLNY